MSVHKYVAVVGLLAALAGLILLFVPVASSRGECGSVVEPGTRRAALSDAYMGRSGSAEICQDALDSRQTWSLILLFGGGVVGLGGWLTSPKKSSEQSSGETATT